MTVKKYWKSEVKKPRGGIRDCGPRSYGNPLFGNKTRGGWPRRRRLKGSIKDIIPWRLIAAGFFVLLIGYGLWYVVWSEAFRVSVVRISGADSESETWIRQSLDDYMKRRSFLVVPNDNALLMSVRDASESVLGKVYLESLTVRKKLPDEIIIEVVERPISAVLAANRNFFALGADGKVVRQLTEGEKIRLEDLPPEFGAIDAGSLGAEIILMPATAVGTEDVHAESGKHGWPFVMVDEGGQPKTADPQVGVEMVSPAAMGIIMTAQAKMREISGDEPKWYTVRQTAETVDVKMTRGWSVYLSTSLPFSVQGEHLSLILKEKVKDRMNELQYIDLRYKERVFLQFNKESADEKVDEPVDQ
jgi:cell division septal protein FtsQ